MAERGDLSGFPQGELTFRSYDNAFRNRIHDVVSALLDGTAEGAPPETYTRYDLRITSYNAGHKETAYIDWPMSREQYENFWRPKVMEDSQPVKVQESSAPDSLDIFRQREEVDEEDTYDPEAERAADVSRRRARLAMRMGAITEVLDQVGNDEFIQAYFDSHGVFDNNQQEQIPLGFNLDGIDRHLAIWHNGEPKHFFHPHNSRRQSQVGRDTHIDTVTNAYTSLDGTEYTSDGDKAAWEAAIREDVARAIDLLKGVPQYYLDDFDAGNHYESGSRHGLPHELGTVATREFFKGYYQFADAGITLLKVVRNKNRHGTIEHASVPGANHIDTLFVAVKHSLASRPRLVQLQAVESDVTGEDIAETRVYGHGLPLDGIMLKHRIGGDYGDITQHPARSLEQMSEYARSNIKPEILERILASEPVGTIWSPFSHEDFYDIIRYLSTMVPPEPTIV